MWLWAWQKVTAAKSIIPASSPLLGPLSRHWPGRYITQCRRTLGRNTSVGPRSHIVMSGCHSTQLISPNSLQGFRLAEVPGFVGMWCFLLLSQGVSEGGICVRPSPQIPGRRLSWERLCILGMPMAPTRAPVLPHTHPSTTGAEGQEVRQEWGHCVNCCPLEMMGSTWSHINLG